MHKTTRATLAMLILLSVTTDAVGGTEISVGDRLIAEKAITNRAKVLEQTMNLDVESAVHEATALLIREELLLTLAEREGVTFSDDYIKDQIAEMRALAEMSDSSATFTIAADSFGLTIDEFVKDARVINTYRKAFVIAEMRERVFSRLRLQPRVDPTTDAVFDQFLLSALNDVTIIRRDHSEQRAPMK
jgi:hypothetical protein